MPYGPHTAADRERMLTELGIASVDDLFADIPADLRASALDLPPPEPELELSARLHGVSPKVAFERAADRFRLGAFAERPFRTYSRGQRQRVSLARALVHLVAILDAFERSGFAPLREEWRSLHAYQGARVRVTPPREPSYEADVVDVAEDGALLVASGGRTIKLASAEIAGESVRAAHGRG